MLRVHLDSCSYSSLLILTKQTNPVTIIPPIHITSCNTLKHITSCNTPKHITSCNTPIHVTSCNTLKHVTSCNTPKHITSCCENVE